MHSMRFRLSGLFLRSKLFAEEELLDYRTFPKPSGASATCAFVVRKGFHRKLQQSALQ